MGKEEKNNKNQAPAAKDLFTFNSEKTREVPSLNLLLNRKKLEISKPSEAQPVEIKTPPPSKVKENTGDTSSQISISQIDQSDFEIEVSGSQAGELILETPAQREAAKKEEKTITHLKIQKSQRKPNKKTTSLLEWEISKLKSGSDPLGNALEFLFEKGTVSALFLAISPPPKNSTVPLFLATAAINPKERQSLWTGLQWDPRIVPEVWNYFLKTGIVEFSPPGTMTNVLSNRNVIRGAFGIETDEWLSLLRVGNLASCRGVVALVSKTSLQLPLRQALRLSESAPAISQTEKKAG